MNSAVWNDTRWRRLRRPVLVLAVLLAALALLMLVRPEAGLLPDVLRGGARDMATLVDPAAPGTSTATGSLLHDSWLAPVLQDGLKRPTALVAVLASAFALSFVALLLAVTQRTMHDASLAAAALLWAAHTGLAGVVAANPVAQRGALMVILTAFAGLVGWYVARLLRMRLSPGGELAMLTLALSGLVVWALHAAGAVDGAVAQALVMLVALALGGWLLRAVVQQARHGLAGRRQPFQAWMVALLLSAVLGAMALDVLRLLRSAPGVGETIGLAGASLLMRWAVLLLLGMLTAVRIDQVAHAMQQLERSHRAWRERVRETQRSLEAAEAQLSSRERADGLRRRRDRLLRELHDEMSQRLTSAIRLSQAGGEAELQRLLDASLTDLQLALDALEVGRRPLQEALVELRQRVEPLLLARGIRLSWVIGPGIDSLALTAPELLQLLRVAQEALADVARADNQARQAALELEVLHGETGRHLRLVVFDDGQAADTGRDPAARSWITLQSQAKALGAQIVAGAQPDGWAVELIMPLRGR